MGGNGGRKGQMRRHGYMCMFQGLRCRSSVKVYTIPPDPPPTTTSAQPASPLTNAVPLGREVARWGLERREFCVGASAAWEEGGPRGA